nr:uncharacterized protein LOC124811655 [Hydra vulgaris]
MFTVPKNYITNIEVEILVLFNHRFFVEGTMGPKNSGCVFQDAVKHYLAENFTLHGEIHTHCKNGHVIYLFTNNGESIGNTLKLVNDLFNLKTSKHKLYNVINISKKWTTNYVRDCSKFIEFCNQPFAYHAPSVSLKQAMHLNKSHSLVTVSETSVLLPQEHIAILPLVNDEPILPVKSIKNETGKHASREELTPKKAKLITRLSFLSSQLASSTRDHRQKIAKLKSKYNSMPYKLKVFRQNIKRKEDIIKALRAEVRELKKEIKTYYYKSLIHKLKAKTKALKVKEKQNLMQIKVKNNTNISANKMFIAQLENDISQIKEGKIPNVNMSDGDKTYPLQMRMIIYGMLLANVPTGNIGFLISKIGQYLGVNFTDIPHRCTIEQMARELGSIAELQAAEWAMSNSHLTLGFDATTQEGVHINTVHLTSKNNCQVIALDQLPGGTAVDYESHICGAIDHLAFIYSDFHLLPFNECRSSIISNISNTMSDRVSVNHLTISKICNTWGKNLNELNCHLHPLDTIAISCCEVLKSLEIERCELFGYDCMAVKIVLAMNKMRFKDGKGDPQGFVNFLDNNKLPRGIIPRYRGNRLHILFHTCFIFMKHYTNFLHYLTTGTVKCFSLQPILREAFCNATAIKQMGVLALFSKLLSGPWMTKFYVSANNASFDHVTGIQVVKNVLKEITNCKSNSAALFCSKMDFFGTMLEPSILKSITNLCPIVDQLVEMTSACLNAVEEVLTRQYKRYFSLSITEALKTETASARLHNIDSEELIGMLSDAKGRCPNATICYISSKLRSKKNRTIDYLDNLDVVSREKVVKWSIYMARKKRMRTRLLHNEIRVEITGRQVFKRQKMDEKQKKKVRA